MPTSRSPEATSASASSGTRRFAALLELKVWLAAAGQIVFTLSAGRGIIHTYASYIEPEDDVALTGLSTVSLNEVAEVVLGGNMALTA